MTSSDNLIASARQDMMLPGRNPRRRLAVVACMDARVDPLRILRATTGDLHVIRNAGGLVTEDAVRSLAISQRFLETNQVMVMMHTDCGMLGLDDEAVADTIAAETGQRPRMSFGGFDDLEAELRAGVESLRANPLLLHRDRITGAVYDVVRQGLRVIVS